MKTIVITGTSRGIGLEIARGLCQSGHRVIALSRHKNEQLDALENLVFIPSDLTQENGLQDFEKYINQQEIQIDAVIHNAGALVLKPFETITSEEFLHIYQVNVFGVAKLNQLCLPKMKSGSHVVTISSMGGIQGSMKFPGLAAYSSSKGAVITLSELLAEEYKEQGISFNVLALGAVQTEMLAEAFPGYDAPISPKNMAEYIADFALNGHRFFNGKVLQVASTTP